MTGQSPPPAIPTGNIAPEPPDGTDRLLETLIDLCDALAWDRPASEAELYRLTARTAGPPPLVRLAEAFGLMLVKLEARKMHRENLIRELAEKNLAVTEARDLLARRNQALNQAVYETYGPRQMVGQCPAIRRVTEMALSIARRPINTMILGPTGAGKEVVAKMIHYNSARREGDFIAVNCTAIPETLFESEMFGIEKGVATGVNQRRGLIEAASGGTLFLDELGEMSLANQAKLLRVLEEKAVQRVGGARPIPVDLLVVSATNADIFTALEHKRFREDLYYRLNVAEVRLPPLRDRGDDVLLLARLFLGRHAARLGRPPLDLAREAAALLQRYPWPGNVRELNNEMERAAALTVGEIITPEDLSPRLRGEEQPRETEWRRPPELKPAETGPVLQNLERQAIVETLARHGSNKTRAARELGLSREGLRKKLKRLGLD